MNSYTISELLPSSDYNVMLCLKKNKHIIPVIVMMIMENNDEEYSLWC